MKLSERDRRFLMIGACSALVFAILNWGVLPLFDQSLDSSQQLTLAEKKLRQRKELVAEAPQAQTEFTKLQSQLDAEEKRLLPTSDPSQAGPQLQQWLAQRAAEQRVEIGRSDFLAVAPLNDRYLRVPVRLDLNAPITQIAQFMNSLERGDRMIAIDEITINSSGPDKEKKVHCSMVVSGLMAKGA